MKLVTAVVLLWVGSTIAVRQSNLYKNKRIIKVRVPPRHYPDFYNGPKGFGRPSGTPIRFKESQSKYHEFSRPFYNTFNNGFIKYQSRPPPPQPPLLFGKPYSGLGHLSKGFINEVHHKYPLTYGSSFPHKSPSSTFKFPTLKEEIHITHTPVVTSQPSPAQSTLSPSSSSSSGASSYSSLYKPSNFYSSQSHTHIQSSEDNGGPIKEIPAPNLGPKPSEALHTDDYTTYGKGPSIDVTNLVSDSGAQQLTFPANEYYSAFGATQNFDLVNDNHLSTVYPSDYYKNNHVTSPVGTSNHETVITDEPVASTPSPDELFKSSPITVTPVPSPSAGYEVTEEQPHSGRGASNIASTQYYYAPDPEPSVPTHKVPPTKEIFHDEKLAETYIPQQNFQVLEGGTVAAPLTTLSTQELFHLMHGFPRQFPVVAEPFVTILGQPQPGGVFIQPNYAYTQTEVNQYVPQTTGTEQQASQQVVIQKPENYFPQEAYSGSYTHSSTVQNYHSQNEPYELQSSESQKQGSLTRSVQETPVDSSVTQDENRIIIHLNKLPEVPLYTTLPNKEAAERLASLQAAGSIGSNYFDRSRVAQPEQNEIQIPDNFGEFYIRFREDESEDSDSGSDDQSQQQQSTNSGTERDQEAPDSSSSSVEIQKSIPVFESSYTVSSLVNDEHTSHHSVENDIEAGSFGQKIRPK